MEELKQHPAHRGMGLGGKGLWGGGGGDTEKQDLDR